jgi:hypothetical protein
VLIYLNTFNYIYIYDSNYKCINNIHTFSIITLQLSYIYIIKYKISKDEYELLFEHASLGFKVKNGEDSTVIVSMILDSGNTDKMFVGDTIICINGVPLNKICDHKMLARKTRDVGRPLKVCFFCEYTYLS